MLRPLIVAGLAVCFAVAGCAQRQAARTERSTIDARLLTVPALRYVPIDADITAPVEVGAYPERITNAALDSRIMALTAALAEANGRLRIIACMQGSEPGSSNAKACRGDQ